MKLTNEQIEEILDGAPEGATHVEHTGLYSTSYLFMPRGDGTHKIWANEIWASCDNRRMEQCWPINSLSDLHEIIELRQEVERLKASIKSAVGNMEYAAFNLCENMDLSSRNGGRVIESTCPEKSLLIAIRDLKEATGAE